MHETDPQQAGAREILAQQLDMQRVNRKNLHLLVTLGVAALLLSATYLFFWSMKGFNENYVGTTYIEGFHVWAESDQYANLADSLLHGHLYLDLPVSDALAGLDNPYSWDERATVAEDPASSIYLDHAYYDGKYYSYFGVVPALLVYAPYELLTGQWLVTPYAVAFLGVLAIWAFVFLVYALARRFQTSATKLSVLLALLCMFGGTGLMYFGSQPFFYAVAQISSLVFTSLGLALWLLARRESADGVTLSLPCLFFGSLFMCLNLGCRPQFVLACLLAFLLFWREILRERLLFSKAGMPATVAALLPIPLVFAPLLWYNYARFGSVFEFGAQYNLTGFDMTSYRQRWILTARLSWYCLLALPHLSRAFPFIKTVPTDYSDLQALDPDIMAPTEPMFGGYMWLVPVAWLVVLLPRFRTLLARKGLFGACVVSLVVFALVFLMDVRMAGVSQRYFCDYGYFLMLVTVVVLFAWQEHCTCVVKRPRCWHAAACLVIVLLTASALLGLGSLLSPERYNPLVTDGAEWVRNLLG